MPNWNLLKAANCVGGPWQCQSPSISLRPGDCGECSWARPKVHRRKTWGSRILFALRMSSMGYGHLNQYMISSDITYLLYLLCFNWSSWFSWQLLIIPIPSIMSTSRTADEGLWLDVSVKHLLPQWLNQLSETTTAMSLGPRTSHSK